MIEWTRINEFDTNTPEGKVLLSAIAVLTMIDHDDIKKGKWGGKIQPDTAIKQIVELANKIFYEEEWKQEQEIIKRDNKINKILNNE